MRTLQVTQGPHFFIALLSQDHRLDAAGNPEPVHSVAMSELYLYIAGLRRRK
jgi:hypothetical protein